MIKILLKVAAVLGKKRQYFRQFFGENVFKNLNIGPRIARWSQTRISVSVYYGPWNGECWYTNFMIHWNILRPCGILNLHLVYIEVIRYIFPILVHCTEKNLATLSHTAAALLFNNAHNWC
jgi:hypothetical protein